MIGVMDILPASILVIESHPLMREALCTAISDEPDLRVGMLAISSAAALRMLDVVLPDIILFAIGNPGTDDLGVLGTLRQSVPQIPILALTSDEVPGQEQAISEAGAYTVLTKAAERLELISKLREIWIRKLVNDSDINPEEAMETISP